jgi:hypothetical protein
MNEHARRLIDDDQMLVLENNIERDVFRPHRVLARRVELDLDEVAAADPEPDILKPAVHLTPLVSYDTAQVHSAEAGKALEKEVLEPGPRGPIRYDDSDLFGHYASLEGHRMKCDMVDTDGRPTLQFCRTMPQTGFNPGGVFDKLQPSQIAQKCLIPFKLSQI